MQRARFLTAWEEGDAAGRARVLADIAVVALFAACVLGATAAILAHPKTPIWDQARLLEARFEAPVHPAPSTGFTSQLLVIGLKAALPASAPLHEVVRSVAMLFWAGAATWLAFLCLERRSLVAAVVVLLFTSQYPFLWYSTELFAGGFLCLALAAWVRGAPPWLQGALLALLALSKLELLLVALALGALWTAKAPRRDAAALAASFGATLFVLVLPGLVWMGPEYWTSLGHAGRDGKGFATFRQHYAALVAPFQIGPAPDPWTNDTPYMERVFPGATSMTDVITARGLPYLDFVALSVARGVRKVGWVFQWAWLAVPVLAVAWWRAGFRPGRREQALLLTGVGCLPFVLLAYPHIRYFARYYAIFWILLGIAAERVARGPATPLRTPALGLAGLFGLLALAENAKRAALGLAAAPHLNQYWFSD